MVANCRTPQTLLMVVLNGKLVTLPGIARNEKRRRSVLYVLVNCFTLHPMAKVPKFVKSFFFLFTVAFAGWMLFVDVNDLQSQYRLGRKLRALEAEKEFYEQQIKQVNQDREELLTDDQQLEQVAREKYLMKKPEEDVYVIVSE